MRRFSLGAEPSEDISATTTTAERLAMMWPLAVRAWSLTGNPFPSYTRANIPGRPFEEAMTSPAWSEDFLDMLHALVGADVEFMIVGAHALAVHGIPRSTQDLDIWINASKETLPGS